MNDVLAIILAGGKGSRLEPLTRDRAKPAVPFGGVYRIIDFALSNCVNSGIRKIHVLTQYKAASLDRHVRQAWSFLSRDLGEFVDIYPPQQRIDEQWYQGTADAVYQNIYSIEQERPRHVVILSGDHIYKMDYGRLVRAHEAADARLTIGCLPVTLDEGRSFGVMGVDVDRRVVRFDEKPDQPAPLPDDPTRCLASMGIYVFDADFLYEQLCKDATVPGSRRDFGHDVIPSVIDSHRVVAYPFQDDSTGGPAYWRDVGTIDSFYEANMDLVAVDPELNLYNSDWPIRGYRPIFPPAKFVHGETDGDKPRVGRAVDSTAADGTVVSGGLVRGSLLSHGVRVNSWAEVEDSILFEGVQVGRYCRVRRAIIDKRVVLPERTDVGFDAEADRRRGWTVTDSGITVIGKDTDVE